MKTIICDCDGVVVDFVAGVRKVFKIPEDWQPHKWELWDYLNINKARFWDNIRDRGIDFWQYLPTYPEAEYLVRSLYGLSEGNLIFATSVHEDEISYAGRAVWALTSGLPHRGIYIGEKRILARPDTILIDDNISECLDFIGAGGKAIMYKRPWNNNKHITDKVDDIIKKVTDIYRNIKQQKE